MKSRFLNRPIFLLTLIILVGGWLRLYAVARIPPSLSWDEVSIGYNAYSILKTGRDEHGKFLPLDTFTAYGDYKPPLSIYATVPAVFAFGLTEFAVRLPSALFGIATLAITYFLALELLGSISIALMSAMALAVSPWHIQISRAGFEANIATFFIAVGAWMILLARRKPLFWYASFLPFVASIYTFNSARYFAPLLWVSLAVFCWKSVKANIKKVIIGGVIATVCIAPIVPHLISKEARLRFIEVNIFTDASVVSQANERIAADGNSLLSRLLHNRRVGYARSYLTHFFDNLEPWFLFVKGDGNPKFSIGDVGQLHLVELPLLLAGIYWLFSRHRQVAWLLLFWIVGAIIPAATARETPHALRIENTLPTWQIMIASGAVWVATRQKGFLRGIVVCSIVLFYAAGVVYYLHNYYVHYAREYSGEWQYGYREALSYAQKVARSYDTIVISDTIGRPYMYTLFYTQTDPREYRRVVDGGFDAAGFYDVRGFGKYRFIRGVVSEYKPRTLYILDPGHAPESARKLKTIYLLNGRPALEIFDL